MSDNQPIHVDVGTWVRVAGSAPGEDHFEEVFEFVTPSQVDLVENKLSVESPLAHVVSQARVGDEFELNTNTGKVEMRLLEVGRRGAEND